MGVSPATQRTNPVNYRLVIGRLGLLFGLLGLVMLGTAALFAAAQAFGVRADPDYTAVLALCIAGGCGAGGGRILAEENLGTRISETRAGMAAETGAPLLLSSCPFCMTMFEDGIKGAGFEETLEPKDIVEILVERLPAG